MTLCKGFRLFLLLSVCAALAGGCADDSRAAVGPKKYPYRIVTTVSMVTDIVRQVAGDKAVVEGLLGEGVDPHLYKPTRSDVVALMNADVVFYSGLMLEGKMAGMLEKIGQRGKPVHAVTGRIDRSYLLKPEEMEGHYDPHVWMDVSAWSRCVDAAAKALADYDPANAEYYQANAERYRAELRKLDEYAKRSMATIPPRGRVLITAHDAFNYFGRAYGLQVKGVQGLSTESEAGLQDIRQLIDLIVGRDVKAVFVETSVAEKNIHALLEGAASRGRELTVGGSLYSDAMGPAGTYEGTYIGMIDHNVTTIVRALGGQAPAGGMQGRLSHGSN